MWEIFRPFGRGPTTRILRDFVSTVIKHLPTGMILQVATKLSPARKTGGFHLMMLRMASPLDADISVDRRLCLLFNDVDCTRNLIFLVSGIMWQKHNYFISYICKQRKPMLNNSLSKACFEDMIYQDAMGRGHLPSQYVAQLYIPSQTELGGQTGQTSSSDQPTLNQWWRITRCNDWLPKHQVGDMRSTLVGCVDLGSSEEDSTPGRFRFRTSVLESALRA